MLVGPRNSIIAELTGAAVDWLFDVSPWIALVSTKWDFIKQDYPELWVDKIHDYVWEDDAAIPDRPGRERPTSARAGAT